MRSRFQVAGLGLVLAAAAGLLAFRDATASDGQPSIEGNWTGRAAFRDYRLVDLPGGRGVLEANLTLEQSGGSIEGSLEVRRDDAVAGYLLSGSVGNGNFFLVNGDGASPVVVSGHVTGTGPRQRIRATAIFVNMNPGGLGGEQVVEMELRLGREGRVPLDE